ncbi:DP-EP family protein [Shewanella waksmanii]|uniref:DP-EP family protein n=1 Tax=Shewanella waksmanii TaxID=213783 RepID=UPI00048CF4CA|nr:DP-EP family protein [Shewanella waksmanii]
MSTNTLPQGPTITVEISYDEKAKSHSFSYFDENGNQTCGNVIVKSGETITYVLANSEGYEFIGAGFLTPSDGVIDSAAVVNQGQSLVLQDEDSVVGVTKFQLIVKCPNISNWLISPDPQIVNRGTQ